MSAHLFKEIEDLKRKLLSLSSLVFKNLHLAIESFVNNDIELALNVEEKDKEVDEIEVDIEEDCLKVLALHQPVAIDLRIVIAILKINSDIERVGDLSASIAQKGRHISKSDNLKLPVDLAAMAKLVEKMLDESMKALVEMDVGLAKEICSSDDSVDNIHRKSYELVKKSILKDPDNYDSYVNCLNISKHLESIADMATSIAEEIYYIAEGEIIRHQKFGKI